MQKNKNPFSNKMVGEIHNFTIGLDTDVKLCFYYRKLKPKNYA
jgi:hypothetical protein